MIMRTTTNCLRWGHLLIRGRKDGTATSNIVKNGDTRCVERHTDYRERKGQLLCLLCPDKIGADLKERRAPHSSHCEADKREKRTNSPLKRVVEGITCWHVVDGYPCPVAAS